MRAVAGRSTPSSSKEEAFARIPAGKGYNDVLFDQAGDGRITNLADDA